MSFLIWIQTFRHSESANFEIRRQQQKHEQLPSMQRVIEFVRLMMYPETFFFLLSLNLYRA